MDDPREPSVDHDAIADLVARAILTIECDGKKAPDVNYPEVGMKNRTASPATTARPVCHH